MKNYDAESALPVILQAAKDYDKKLKDRHFLMSVLHVLKNLEARNLISRNDKRTSAGRAISLTTGGIAIIDNLFYNEEESQI